MNMLTELVNSSNSNNSSYVVGDLTFKNTKVFKAGNSATNTYADITLSDGKSLRVSPDDRVYQFEFVVSDENGQSLSKMELPASVFAQARKLDKVYFSMNGKQYILGLSHSVNPQSWKEYSYDKWIKKTEAKLCTESSMYGASEDVPANYSPWGDFVELSPTAKILNIGKPEAALVDFDKLAKIGTTPVDLQVQVQRARDGSGLELYFDVPGEVHTIGEERPIDFIVDSDRLYIHIPPMNLPSLFDELFGFLFHTEKRIRPERQDLFYWMNLKQGTKQIDQDAIVVTRNVGRSGRFQVTLPFSVNTPPTIGVTPFTIACKSSAHTTKVTALFDTGPNSKLAMRWEAEGAGNWMANKEIAMIWTEGNFWTAELPNDFKNLIYKVILKKKDGRVFWEQGSNRTLKPGIDAGFTPTFKQY